MFKVFNFLTNLKVGGCPIENVIYINPIPAGVLENQDTLGWGQFDPPPL